ncbi:MAG: hypothetical protein ABDH49_07225 [Candidatus Hydrothermales bacterium]
MKKLLFLFIPVYLFSIEVRVKPGSEKSYEKYHEKRIKSERIYKIKGDTLDRDGDGIVDNFLKKMRENERKQGTSLKDKRQIKIPEKGLRLNYK